MVYEEKSTKNSTSARNIALGIAIPLFLIIVINYLTNRSEEKSIIPDEAPAVSAPAPRPSAPPAPAESPVAPVAPAGGAPGAAPAGGAAPAAAPGSK